MLTFQQLITFAPAAFVVAITPGANNLLAFNHGTQAGFFSTVMSLVGRFIAFAIMILLVAYGMGELLKQSPFAFSFIKAIGTLYLIYISWILIFSTPPEKYGEIAAVSTADMTTKEFLVAASNPKALLLFTAFLPQFIVPGIAYDMQLITLGGVYILVEFFCACCYAYSGVWVKTHTRSNSVTIRLINRIAGVILLLMAGLLFFSAPP
ncbi:threonine/homoserine/homoserine lactone efflux protein [Pseudomonas sp. W3I7]|uniref:LysE family translocator n=1 Tax=Pseudomonas sp. W3I7 TaxID=3042292 RepID=UPI00278F4993|nr:LysE family translocator [Pseudomonas sp. W3I7]MDQ0704017.1 threonine/homoserine/homoserine lactone efflux protein [Pseudomonas sp. W3I7]